MSPSHTDDKISSNNQCGDSNINNTVPDQTEANTHESPNIGFSKIAVRITNRHEHTYTSGRNLVRKIRRQQTSKNLKENRPYTSQLAMNRAKNNRSANTPKSSIP